jgi:CRP-like cAMP-binding protein
MNTAKNEIVFDQSDDAKPVYLLLSGVAKLFYLGDHERPTIVSLVPRGRVFWSRFADSADASSFQVRSV